MEEENKKEEEGFCEEPEFGIKPLRLTNRKSDKVYGYMRKKSKSVKTDRKIDRKLKKELLKNYGFAVDNN